MPRPVNADPEKTQRNILGAALEVFSRRGYEQASLRMIGETAGVSVGTITHYFDGKEDLFNHLIEQMYGEMRKEVFPLHQHFVNEPPDVAIAKVVRASYEFAMSHRHQVRLLLRGVMEKGAFPKEFKVGGSEIPVIPAVAKLLESTFEMAEAVGRVFVFQWAILLGRLAVMDDEEAINVTGLADGDAAREKILNGLIHVVHITLAANSPKVEMPRRGK